MSNVDDLQAIKLTVTEYLKGMIYGQDDRLRQSMHLKCMQAATITANMSSYRVMSLSTPSREKRRSPMVVPSVMIYR